MQNAGCPVNTVSEHDSCRRFSDAHPWKALLAKEETLHNRVQQLLAADLLSRRIPHARIDKEEIDMFILIAREGDFVRRLESR